MELIEISPKDLKQRLDEKQKICLVDVREPHEFEQVNLGGKLIPLRELPNRYQELNPEQEIVVYCHHGMRSAQAILFLQKVGFKNLKNLKGGIDLWSEEVDPTLARY